MYIYICIVWWLFLWLLAFTGRIKLNRLFNSVRVTRTPENDVTIENGWEMSWDGVYEWRETFTRQVVMWKNIESKHPNPKPNRSVKSQTMCTLRPLSYKNLLTHTRYELTQYCSLQGHSFIAPLHLCQCIIQNELSQITENGDQQ